MIRRRLACLAVALLGAAAFAWAEVVDPDLKQTLRFAMMEQYGLLERVEASQHPDQRDVFAVVADRQARWSGDVSVIRLTNGILIGIADFAPGHKPDGDYFVSAEWRKLPKLNAVVLEVFSASRTGVGCFSLFTVNESVIASRVAARVPPRDDGSASLVAFTNRVIGATFRDAPLKARYRDLNGDGFEDIVLSGVRLPARGQTNETAAPVSRVLFWQPSSQAWVEP
jgi:hypothetical protein